MWETFRCHRNVLPARVPHYVPGTASGHRSSTNMVLTSRQGILTPQTPQNCKKRHMCSCAFLRREVYRVVPGLHDCIRSSQYCFRVCNQAKSRYGATEKGLLMQVTESGHRPPGWHQASTLLHRRIITRALHGGTGARQPGRCRAQGEPARWASDLGVVSLRAAG